ncbi:MAG: hypothetical protein AB8B93_09780 [Pseudomonadales bacterium]
MREEFASYGFSIVAGAVDSEENTAKVADSLGFPVAYGMTRVDADRIGAWWDDRNGGYIQPSEFVLSGDGTVMASTYSNSPIGRMDPVEALKLVKLLAS